MINAQTITCALNKDARCIVATEPGNDRAIDYYYIVDDGADDPNLAWGYSPMEAWDEAAKRAMKLQFTIKRKKGRKI
jgi:hypothetical protein